MKITFRSLIALLLCAGLGSASVGCATSVSAVEVSEVKVEKKKIARHLTIEGVLSPIGTAVVSSRISGQIDRVHVSVGDVVASGQVLVTLDSQAISAQVLQGRAGLQSAQSSLAAAEGQAESAKITMDSAVKNYLRQEALFATQAISAVQLEEAADKRTASEIQYKNASGPALNVASAAVATAEAALSSLQVQLDYTKLHAPLQGVVTESKAAVGETVAPGTPLATITDTSALKLKGTVSQELLSSLSVGQTVAVTVGNDGSKTIEGAISVIGPAALSTGEFFPIEITVANDGSLMAGMTATAELNTESSEALVVPAAAIVKESGKCYVYLLKDSIAVRQEIVTGIGSNGETQVLKGLKEQDAIVLSGAGSVRDGMKVVLKR